MIILNSKIFCRLHTLVTNRFMKFISSFILIFLMVAGSSFKHAGQEEGMYMLNTLEKLNLEKAGLKIPVSDIYNSSGKSLTNALVRLGGCTGSFISDNGLIITNHHCVYGAVSSLSSKDNNLLENGFYAQTNEKEIKINMPCKITQSFDDVSTRVLEGVTADISPDDRMKKIADNIQKITKKEQELSPDLKIEISEMLVGKYYTLFRYKLLDDVRLVFVPPSSIGKFGGESDNWVWPRHNGDFSVVRAYENGKPYKPARHLKVNSGGTKENDFVFILGYPGRTYRHMPAEFYSYQYKHVLPFISEWFNHRINVLNKDAGDDVTKQLSYAGTIASLANTAKNFEGKVQGFTRTSIIADKYEEQKKLGEWVNADATRKKQYGHVFSEISALYGKIMPKARQNLMLSQLFSSSGIIWSAAFIEDLDDKTEEMSKSERKEFFSKNQTTLYNKFKSGYNVNNIAIEKQLLKEMLFRISQLPADQVPDELKNLVGKKNPREAINAWVDKSFKKNPLTQTDVIWKTAEKDMSQLLKIDNDFTEFAEEMMEASNEVSLELGGYNTKLSALLPRLSDIKEAYYQNMFIPDANATLRFTYGYIKGFSPQDAVVNYPFTTIKGILEKAEDKGDYYMADEYLKTFKSVVPADALRLNGTNDVVVAMLYNLDTTGGNSGSPILNAEGEIIGVNFDRAFTATINDFAWNESYSRSIGVDMRYVIYVMKYIGKADKLLDEMKVTL